MDSEILDQLTNLEKNVDSEVTKSKRGRKKKTDTEMNEVDENNLTDKRDRLITCVLSGNSKQYLGKEETEQKLMKWMVITLIYCQIDMNLVHK